MKEAILRMEPGAVSYASALDPLPCGLGIVSNTEIVGATHLLRCLVLLALPLFCPVPGPLTGYSCCACCSVDMAGSDLVQRFFPNLWWAYTLV